MTNTDPNQRLDEARVYSIDFIEEVRNRLYALIITHTGNEAISLNTVSAN